MLCRGRERMSCIARRVRRTKVGPLRSGECIVCKEEEVKGKSSNLQCDVCLNGKGVPGAYHHLGCFFKSHVCYKRNA